MNDISIGFVDPNVGNQGYGMAYASRDAYSGNRIEFYIEAVQNNFKTKKEGRPVFDNIEMVKVYCTDGSVITSKVNEEMLRRYGRQYEAWKNSGVNAVEGFPIEEWPAITASQVQVCKLNNVHVVEQVATVPDSSFQNFGSWIRDLQHRAKDFLENQEDGSHVNKLSAENEELRKQSEKQTEQIVDLGSTVELLKARLEELEKEKLEEVKTKAKAKSKSKAKAKRKVDG